MTIHLPARSLQQQQTPVSVAIAAGRQRLHQNVVPPVPDFRSAAADCLARKISQVMLIQQKSFFDREASRSLHAHQTAPLPRAVRWRQAYQGSATISALRRAGHRLTLIWTRAANDRRLSFRKLLLCSVTAHGPPRLILTSHYTESMCRCLLRRVSDKYPWQAILSLTFHVHRH